MTEAAGGGACRCATGAVNRRRTLIAFIWSTDPANKVQTITETEPNMPITVTITDIDGKTLEIQGAAGATLMETARAAGVAGILAECGGACSCATCHVYIDADWIAQVGPPNPVEADMLDMVDDIRVPSSRLSCQVTLTQDLDGLVVTVAPEL